MGWVGGLVVGGWMDELVDYDGWKAVWVGMLLDRLDGWMDG